LAIQEDLKYWLKHDATSIMGKSPIEINVHEGLPIATLEPKSTAPTSGQKNWGFSLQQTEDTHLDFIKHWDAFEWQKSPSEP
jgi:hypothetical protein